MAWQFEVSSHDDGRRLDSLLRSKWPGLPLGAMMKYFRKGQVRLDGARADYKDRVASGQKIYVPWEAPDTVGRSERPDGSIRRLPLDILWQDEQVLVVNKPAGLLSQPDVKGEDSVVTRALAYGVDAEFLPQLVHRLDRNTSGVMVLALQGQALRDLMDCFRDRHVDKRYLALVKGVAPRHKLIDAPLLKDSEKKVVRVDPSGQKARTEIRCLATDGRYSLVEARLMSGRTHQIRVHLNHIGHALLGDAKYGDFASSSAIRALGIRRPMLHAWTLRLDGLAGHLAHLKDHTFVAPCADDMLQVMQKLGFQCP